MMTEEIVITTFFLNGKRPKHFCRPKLGSNLLLGTFNILTPSLDIGTCRPKVTSILEFLGLAHDAFQIEKVLSVEETLFMSETFKHKVCLWPASSKI